MQKVYLSRRNLQTLLNKLDRNVAAQRDVSECTVVKKDTLHPVYPCSDVIEVIALEDNEYYTDRAPGRVHDADAPSTAAEYRVQVQSLKTGEWRDSINEGVNNPYDSFYIATAVARQQQTRGSGLKYKVTVVPTPKKYRLEYFSNVDQEWCASINYGVGRQYDTHKEAEENAKRSQGESLTGLQYRVVEVDS